MTDFTDDVEGLYDEQEECQKPCSPEDACDYCRPFWNWLWNKWNAA